MAASYILCNLRAILGRKEWARQIDPAGDETESVSHGAFDGFAAPAKRRKRLIRCPVGRGELGRSQRRYL